jgi:hypothetical protein
MEAVPVRTDVEMVLPYFAETALGVVEITSGRSDAYSGPVRENGLHEKFDRKRECESARHRQNARALPSASAATKSLWSAPRNVTFDRRRAALDFRAAVNQFAILCEWSLHWTVSSCVFVVFWGFQSVYKRIEAIPITTVALSCKKGPDLGPGTYADRPARLQPGMRRRIAPAPGVRYRLAVSKGLMGWTVFGSLTRSRSWQRSQSATIASTPRTTLLSMASSPASP